MLTACSSEEESAKIELPDHISQLENVTVYDPDIQPADTVMLTRETIFESGEDVFMEGNIRRLAVDDKGRVWVATIVKNFSVHEWWVLEENGELMARFEWPRDEPIVVIKEGKIYTRQTDEETGLQQVVRYRVEIN
ncbi:MAG: hypothetical protein EA390_04565 [Balneolaceae bacterium]|nr:MAG: hypothetical protein EA390_04565 [Balneolaceae bacterium]